MILQSILMPHSEFDHPEKGDALFGKLLLLHNISVCDEVHDVCEPIYCVSNIACNENLLLVYL